MADRSGGSTRQNGLADAAAGHTAPSEPEWYRPLLLLAGPAIWFAHLSVSYALVPFSCRVGSDLPLHLATIVAVAGASAIAVLARRGMRRLGGAPTVDWYRSSSRVAVAGDRADGRRMVLALALGLAAFSALVVAVTGLVAVVVDRCA